MGDKPKRGCLVIHGLTGTPVTMKPVIDALIEANFEVDAPLLPGHGTRAEDLSKVSWEDWWGAVLDAYRGLQQRSDSISCVGLSLGSLLALKLAEMEGLKISSVVSMGTPLFLGNFIEYIAYPAVKYTPIRWFYRYSKKDWIKSVADAGGREFYIRHSYDKLAVHAVLEIFKLKRDVLKNLLKIMAPLFVVHGREDQVAPIRNAETILEILKSRTVDQMVLNRSRHVVTLDYERDKVSKAVVAFLDKFS